MDSSKRGEGCPKPMGVKISRTTLFSEFTGRRCENQVDGDCDPTSLSC
jgi:hypothetical protein